MKCAEGGPEPVVIVGSPVVRRTVPPADRIMATSFLVVVCAAFAFVMLQAPSGGRTLAQDLFAFPVDEVLNPYQENARNRTPIYLPGKCSPNEILYPGDNDNDWVCDCRPGYVYYPQNDSCYALYQQGFCEPGEYVDLARPSMLTKCTKNVCPGKNKVPYKERCVELHRNNRLCPIRKRISWVIGVNVTTLELDCIEGFTELLEVKVDNRNTDDTDHALPHMASSGYVLFAGAKRCNNGTKAMFNGLCS
ncbi:uncharacterized protein LOC128730500 [Anopheles nili]|uniref:uncharacterized protein LOC128730500 n=1 Tax=Anopheles nili TaxID=185578 RepID=UPI00237AAD57|nr:uncharacterized protein LOC128730500 [Anopheles nili]